MYLCVVGGGGVLLWSENRVQASNHKLLGTGYTLIKPIHSSV